MIEKTNETNILNYLTIGSKSQSIYQYVIQFNFCSIFFVFHALLLPSSSINNIALSVFVREVRGINK